MNNLPSLSWASMPSALKGAARTIDMFGKLDEYKTSPSADRDLIGNDWLNVGSDLKMSIDTYGQEQKSLAENTSATAQ